MCTCTCSITLFYDVMILLHISVSLILHRKLPYVRLRSTHVLRALVVVGQNGSVYLPRVAERLGTAGGARRVGGAGACLGNAASRPIPPRYIASPDEDTKMCEVREILFFSFRISGHSQRTRLLHPLSDS